MKAKVVFLAAASILVLSVVVSTSAQSPAASSPSEEIIPSSYAIWVLIAIHHPPTDLNESNPAVFGVYASEAACKTILEETVKPRVTEYEKSRCYSTPSPHLSGIWLLEQAKTWGLDVVINREMEMLRENCEMYYVSCNKPE